MSQATAIQLEGSLVVESIIGEGGVWVLGGRGWTGAARSTSGNGGLGADDGGRAVGLAEMGERDLSWGARVSHETEKR